MADVKKKSWFARHKFLTVALALIVVVIAAQAAGGGDSKNSSSNSNNSGTNTSTKNESKTAKIGEVAPDGKFEFTVDSYECGKTSVGTNQYLTKQAQGQFCLLSVTVKNIGNEAQTFDSSSQLLFEGDVKYSADGGASLYANEQGSTFLNQINPGNTVKGVIVFDVPKDKKPTLAELHDSPFSSGVEVNLQ